MASKHTGLTLAEEKLVQFKDKTKLEAENAVKEVFPKKVLELDALYKSPICGMNRLEEVGKVQLDIPVPNALLLNDDGCVVLPKRRRMENGEAADVNLTAVNGTHVMLFANGAVPCNKHISELVTVVKPLVQEAIEYTNTVKMWIQYMIPKIEDGNNFGVSIQEETQAQVSQAESDCATYLDQISRYYVMRAKLIAKVAKFPHITDFRVAVQETDEKEFLTLRLIVCELRNVYASLQDLILKNMEKIKQPRSEIQKEHFMY